MSKKRKGKYTAEETKAYDLMYKSQDFKQVGGIKYEWVDITFYMIDHPKYKGLSGNAVKLYTYLRKWAYNSEMWKKTERFEYSQSLAQRDNIMSQAEAKRSLDELWKSGFIDKVGKGRKGTNIWKFSNRWYTGEPIGYVD